MSFGDKEADTDTDTDTDTATVGRAADCDRSQILLKRLVLAVFGFFPVDEGTQTDKRTLRLSRIAPTSALLTTMAHATIPNTFRVVASLLVPCNVGRLCAGAAQPSPRPTSLSSPRSGWQHSSPTRTPIYLTISGITSRTTRAQTDPLCDT